MRFYEAKTDEEIHKISSWASDTQTIPLALLCWSFKHKTDFSYLKALLANPEVHLTCVEDDAGNLQGLFYFEVRDPTRHKIPAPIMTQPSVIVTKNEWDMSIANYFVALLQWSMKYAYETFGVLKGEFWAIEKAMSLCRLAFGDFVEVTEERVAPLPEMVGQTFFKLDLSKFAISSLVKCQF